jgi:hypothetical protein
MPSAAAGVSTAIRRGLARLATGMLRRSQVGLLFTAGVVFKGGAVNQVMIRCRRTGASVPTGVDADTTIEAPPKVSVLVCEQCGSVHIWDRDDVLALAN